jgi:hypothetical protein
VHATNRQYPRQDQKGIEASYFFLSLVSVTSMQNRGRSHKINREQSVSLELESKKKSGTNAKDAI